MEQCQTQITSADCNAVISTHSHDTDRSDMNSLQSSTFLTSIEQPLAQLSESKSDDVQHINRQRACHQANCDCEFCRLADICTSATDAEYNSDNLSDIGQLFKKAQKMTKRSNICIILQNLETTRPTGLVRKHIAFVCSAKLQTAGHGTE